jgi:hypothetical protein
VATKAFPTRALLMCGVVAGPLYVAVTLAEALTRDGFDWMFGVSIPIASLC